MPPLLWKLIWYFLLSLTICKKYYSRLSRHVKTIEQQDLLKSATSKEKYSYLKKFVDRYLSIANAYPTLYILNQSWRWWFRASAKTYLLFLHTWCRKKPRLSFVRSFAHPRRKTRYSSFFGLACMTFSAVAKDSWWHFVALVKTTKVD